MHPGLWTYDFLSYDYIGAPWHDGVVGNGGFCIESRRLAQAKMMLPFAGRWECKRAADMWLCRDARNELEDKGMRWAPTDLAQQFSIETTGHNLKAFGFHGKGWAPKQYADAWRILEDQE